MEAAHCEIQSFVWKYMHLCSMGFNASLNLNCVDGQTVINLSTAVHHHPEQPIYSKSSQSGKVKPSRLRRRKKRQEYRRTLEVDKEVHQSFDLPHEVTNQEFEKSIMAEIEFGDGVKDILQDLPIPSSHSDNISSMPLEPQSKNECPLLQPVSPQCQNNEESAEAMEELLDRPLTALSRVEFSKLMDEFCSNFKLDLTQPLLPPSK